jgi:GR25 family glycosyltransferase involved in LPS biosynthesis
MLPRSIDIISYPPQCACAISHLLVWHRIVEEDLDFALILEDDVVPFPHSGVNLMRHFSHFLLFVFTS